MERFQTTVLVIAIIVLIVILIIIGMTLSTAKKNKPWPPMNAQCLDYWEIDGSGNCVDTMDLAKLKCPNGNVTSTNGHSTMNFNTPPYVGAKGACAKYNWAKQCGLSWDGVTYGVKNPCQS